MRKRIFMAAIFSTQLGFVGCDRDRDRDTKPSEAMTLEKAREVEPEKYAPAIYASAIERDDEALARRALAEAMDLRNEARLTAEEDIRDAEVLLDVVEKLRVQADAEPRGLPSEKEISRLRDELSRARQAFQGNDFPTAGMAAQRVVTRLGGPLS